MKKSRRKSGSAYLCPRNMIVRWKIWYLVKGKRICLGSESLIISCGLKTTCDACSTIPEVKRSAYKCPPRRGGFPEFLGFRGRITREETYVRLFPLAWHQRASVISIWRETIVGETPRFVTRLDACPKMFS